MNKLKCIDILNSIINDFDYDDDENCYGNVDERIEALRLAMNCVKTTGLKPVGELKIGNKSYTVIGMK